MDGHPPDLPATAKTAGFLEQLARRHLAAHDITDDLITVCASPNGVSSYVAGAPDAAVRSVRHEQGAVVCRAEHEQFGTLVSVLGGPSVVEVALHDTPQQRDAYRETLAAVDAENREQALASVQAMAVGMLRELGVTVDNQDEEQG